MNDKTSEMQNVVLREQLTELRTRAQLTQRELSKQLGRPQSYVSKYESGEKKLTLVEIRKIAVCCGTNLTDFITAFEEELLIVEE